VPGDHFDPGESMAVSGTEFDPGVELVLRLVNGSTTAELGRATVADDRTFAATSTVPTTFPTGYAELTATDPGGTTWSTYVLIGDRAEGPGAAAEPPDVANILALGLFAVGALLFAIAGYRYVRR
jgi:hypothetical protein